MELSKHLENAADAVRRRNYPAAVKLYSQLVALQPDSVDARSGLRTALFKKAEAKPPSKLFALLGGGVNLVLGFLLRLARQHEAAARAFERYLVLDPLNESVNLTLGNSLERAGLENGARAVFQAVAEHNPRCLEACRRAGALLYRAGKQAEALEMYERALKVDPRDQESLKARKNLAAEEALQKTGIETATGSRELLKDAAQARQLQREERLQLTPDEIAEEITQTEEKLTLNPTDSALLVRMADLVSMEGDLASALSYLEQAQNHDPENSDLSSRTGRLRLKLQEQRVATALESGDESAAGFARQALWEARATEYRRQVDQNPTDLRLRFALGRALVDLERFDDAIAELQQAVKDPKVKGEALHLLGESFAAKGMDELALGQLEKALDLVTDTGQKAKEILYAMGCVAQNTGQLDRALAHFSRIMEQDIGFRDVSEKVDALRSTT